MKHLTIREMITELEKHEKILGPDEPVYYYVPGGESIFLHEHAPLEVEEIQYRNWANSSLLKLIIK